MLYAEGLRDRGHDLRVIVESGSPIHEMAERQKLPVITLSMRRANYGSAILAIRSHLRQQRPDIVHVNSSRDSWVASLATQLVRPRPKILRSRYTSVPLNKNLFTRVLHRRLCNCDRRRADAKGVDRAGWD
jgi:hypothetical protein